MADSDIQHTPSQALGKTTRLVASLLVFVLVVVLFYGLNHAVMGMQGLPLNLDLTPAG